MSQVKLKFCGGVNSVTGANFMLYTDEVKILIDCGLNQGHREDHHDPNRDPFPYDPKEIDFLIITHAHADHIGRIPKLVKDGFRGKIYSTSITRELVYPMLEDATNVMYTESKKNKIEPMHDMDHVDLAMSLWNGLNYHQSFRLNDEFSLFFKDAGHILGSAMVELTHIPTNKKIVFTGDLGNTPTPLIRDTEDITDANFLIMESVYGDRNHEDKHIRKNKLKDSVMKIIQRKGTLLIPVFSLEKTQVLLHELNDLIEGGEVPSIPVFFDSPLGIKLTDIYARQFQAFNQKVQDRIKRGDDIFDFPKLIKTYDIKQGAIINSTPPPKIIIASSGMSVGGRIMEHEKNYLPDPKNMILFIGFQVSGSVGRRILEGDKNVSINGTEVSVKAEVSVINGYSSHKDSDSLIDFVSHTADSLEKVFVVMGETKSALFLAQRLNDNLGVKAIHPNYLDDIVIIE